MSVIKQPFTEVLLCKSIWEEKVTCCAEEAAHLKCGSPDVASIKYVDPKRRWQFLALICETRSVRLKLCFGGHVFNLHLCVCSLQGFHISCLISTSSTSPSCWFTERRAMRGSAKPNMDWRGTPTAVASPIGSFLSSTEKVETLPLLVLNWQFFLMMDHRMQTASTNPHMQTLKPTNAGDEAVRTTCLYPKNLVKIAAWEGWLIKTTLCLYVVSLVECVDALQLLLINWVCSQKLFSWST